ncbi:MAG: hypothetical protein KUG82_21305 [Pseudomonadales bacterium]|nr:hypothetical protein [Pseudomonadales bacterium]
MDTISRSQLAFEYARDATKQLMALATGVIALTVTFSKDFIGTVPEEIKWHITWIWVLLLISVFFGQICLMTLTGILGSNKEPKPPLNIYNFTVKITSILQFATFFIGLSLAVKFAISAI